MRAPSPLASRRASPFAATVAALLAVAPAACTSSDPTSPSLDLEGGDGGASSDAAGSGADGGSSASTCNLPAPKTAVRATGSSGDASSGASIDHDLTTAFTSAPHPTAQNAESISISFARPESVDVVGVAPRFVNGAAAGFPVELVVSWFDGAKWNDARAFTHVPQPQSPACVTLPLGDTVQAQGIRVTAKVLGADGPQYDLSFAEIVAGLDPARDGAFAKPTSATASSESQPASSWAAAHAVDGDPTTLWSSAVQPSAAATESLSIAFPSPTTVNEIKLVPRYDATGRALGFPTAFTVSSVDGAQVTTLESYASFPTPHRGDAIVLPLRKPATTGGLRIEATSLGQDDVGNHVFQLAEATAGYDPGFESFHFTGNDGATGLTAVDDVGSEEVDRPDQLQHWDYDARGIVIAPSPGPNQNIYAPSVVYRGGRSWDVFFGGWDGSPTGNDRIYRTTSPDDFATIGPHSLVIDHGVYIHTNNDCVVQLAAADFRMMYTTYDGSTNKPATSQSSDGQTWNPSSGTAAALISMTGYPNWAGADVNGGNVIYREPSGTWHLYFDDFQSFPGVHHATSTDFVHFTYVGKLLPDAMVMNDFKAFTYGGTTYYVGAYHFNTDKIWTTVSTSLVTAPAPQVAFTNAGAADRYMVAVGLVQDGKRLYGALYGAGAVGSLDQNRIFAAWLQKKVLFTNASVRWGDIEHGVGPDKLVVYSAEPNSVETGRFEVYDTDGTSLLYRSPVVTMRAGDTWRYEPR